MKLQSKLLGPEHQSLRPDEEFLQMFAGVVESKWPSLAVALGLREREMKEVKRSQGSPQHLALLMLRKWVSNEGATYGQLLQQLKKVSLFQ